MEAESTPEFVLSPVRLQTMRPITFFYVVDRPVPFADLDKVLDPLIDALYAAKAQAGLGEAGPDIVRYYRVEGDDQWLMEVGIPVKAGTQPAGAAQVKTLPSFRCASLLLGGSLAHIATAYETLRQAIREAGLQEVGDCREWNYYFESVDSPHNVMGLYIGIS